MLRKLFRRILPDHEAILANRFIARMGPRIHHPGVWCLHRRSVAMACAVGMFAGLVPGSNPVQFAVAGILAVLFRVNLPIAVGVTLYSNPFTIVPLYYAAYKLGQLSLMEGNGPLPTFDGSVTSGFVEWVTAAMHWLGAAGKPLLIGVPILAFLLGVAAYILVDWTWRLSVRWQWRTRRGRKR